MNADAGRLHVEPPPLLLFRHFPLRNDVGWYARDMWMLGSTILYLIGGAGQFRMSSTNASDRERAATIIKVLGAPSNQAIDKVPPHPPPLALPASSLPRPPMISRTILPNRLDHIHSNG